MGSNLLRKQFSRTITVPHPLHPVFTCFCPIAELDWAPGWNCVMIYSASGVAEKDCVFTTHHPGLPTMVWVCTIYDADQEIEYVRVTPEHFVTSVNIKTTAVGDQTSCVIKYTHTALSAGGAQFLEHHVTEQAFESDIDDWPAQISAYLDASPA